MRLRTPLPPHGRFRGRIALALGVLLALVGGLDASGASVSARSSEPGGHRCKCGMKCRTVCCCDHGSDATEETTRPSTPSFVRPEPSSTPTSAGPCVCAAPCGGAEPTTVAPITRVLAPAALMPRCLVAPTQATERLALLSSHRLLDVPPSRLDKPPESRTSA